MKRKALIFIASMLLLMITFCSCHGDGTPAGTGENTPLPGTGSEPSQEGNVTEKPRTSGSAATFEELKTLLEKDTNVITLTADITVSETLYVMDDVTLIASADCTLQRDVAFTGDMFVIGENARGEHPVLLGRLAGLSLKPEEGVTLTVDGNSENITKTVCGSAFFVTNSGALNVYDGVSIVNHTKMGNAKLSEATPYYLTHPLRAGGAAVLVADGVFNMHGGLISNCHVNTKDSANTAQDDQTAGYDNSSCGGAVYNHGTFNMYGGTVSDSSAARGGAIYSYRVANILSGTLEGNSAAAYGGAVYMVNSQYVNTVIGNDGTKAPVRILENSCDLSGGAFYVAHQSSVYVKGNTTFEKNTAKNNGGALNVAGEMVITSARFLENKAWDKGGAIYSYYGQADLSRRVVRIDGGSFEKNVAGRGGAICFSDSGSVTEGALGKIGTVTFLENKAVTDNGGTGNGGALYLSAASTVTFIGSPIFEKNSATKNGGAIYITGASIVNTEATDAQLSFKECTAGGNGGAIYAYTDTVVTLPKLIAISNSAAGNGGAMYVSQSANVTVNGVASITGNASTGTPRFHWNPRW